jgi:acyl-CoA thioester hydrolase
VNAPRVLITAPISVRWGDMDALGHVNNSVFATYLEEARLRWFAGIPGGWRDEHASPVLAAQTINFRMPIVWPEELVITLTLARVGNSSLAMDYVMTARDTPSRRYADGNVVMVWTGPDGRPVALPTHLRAAAEAS